MTSAHAVTVPDPFAGAVHRKEADALLLLFTWVTPPVHIV